MMQKLVKFNQIWWYYILCISKFPMSLMSISLTWCRQVFGTFNLENKLVMFAKELFHCRKSVLLSRHPTRINSLNVIFFNLPLSNIISFFHVFVDTFGVNPRRTLTFVSKRNRSDRETEEMSDRYL